MAAFSGAAVAVKMAVSRETSGRRHAFHVKQRNESDLLSYTEIPENDVQNVLDIDPPGQPAEAWAADRSSSATNSSRPVLAFGQRPVKGILRRIQCFSMPFPA